MRVVAIIQARVGSTRLPGKVLSDIAGRTMLARVVRRTMRCTLIDEVIVATTTQSADDDVVRECTKLGVVYFRGGEADVLDRYYRAAKKVRAEKIRRGAEESAGSSPREQRDRH